MSDNAAAQVSASVVVPAGQANMTFNVSTSSVGSNATANIQATFNSSSKSAALTIVPAPMITSFVPGSATITSGNSTTLTAVFSNGTGSVDHGVGIVTSGTAVTVSPGATTTYTLTVTNAAGTSVTKPVTVTVVAAPVITSFIAGASTITSGTSTTLTAVFSNGTGSVDNGVGAVTSGTAVTVTPAATTTYTLTVTNTAGTSVTNVVKVTVVPPPVITSFTANPTTINITQMSSLTATFTNGAGTVDNGVGAVTSGTPVSVAPSVTTTYTLTVTNPAGTAVTKPVTVTVDTPPVFGTNGCAAFSFTVGANGSCNIATTGNPTPTLSLTSGSLPSALTFTANSDGTATIAGIPATGTAGSYPLTITATNSVASTPQSFTLMVVLTAPPVFTSSASASITAGTTGSFTVTATGSPAPSLSVPPGSLPAGVTFTDNHNGTATIAGSATTTAGNSTFTITATNTFGGTTHTVTQPFTLHLVAAPTITSFVSGTSPITAGTSTTLTAVFSNGTGSVDNGEGTVMSGTAVNVSPASTTTYTLTVTNAAGTSVTKPVTVTVVAAPVITSFTAGASTIVSGTSTTLTAVFSNGTGSVDNGVGAVTSGTPVTVMPASTVTYTLTVKNSVGDAAGTKIAQVMVTVDTPPAFTSAASAQFFVGVNGTFSVTTTGNPPPSLSVSTGLPSTLAFHDNGGGTATISGTPASGDIGSHPVTITATNSVGSTPQTFTLTVTAAAAVVSTSVGLLPPLFAGELFGNPPTNASLTINITVTNDAAGDVVTAGLTVDANTTFNCTMATCGILGSVTGVSGSGNYTVQYTPPSSAPNFVQTFPTLVVNSSLPGAIGSTDFIEVDPAGILVQVFPVGRGGEAYVGVSPADTRNLTVNIYNDSLHAGVNFNPLTATGYSCGTLTTNQCGTLGTPSSLTSSTDPTTGVLVDTLTIPYTAPAALPAAPYNTPLVLAIALADGTRSASASFLLDSATSLPALWINKATQFKSVPLGSANATTLFARILGDTGALKTVNWTLTANGVNCAPACGTLGSPTVAVSGTTVDATITYTPPTTLPAGAANTSYTITAASADTPPGGIDSFSFNIFDPTCGTGNDKVLNGQYAFLARGGAAPGGYFADIGSFTADGAGHITAGSQDGNTSAFGPFLGGTLLTSPMGSLPASSYSVGSDNRGCLTLADSTGALYTFRFAVGTLDASNHATRGRIIRFDDASWRGRAQSGILLKQDAASFAANQFSGNYAFGLAGEAFGGGNAVAGVLSSNGSGSVTSLNEDEDLAISGFVPNRTGSGSYTLATNAPGGRGTATTTIGLEVIHYVFYMVSSSDILIMTSDNVDTSSTITLSILTGELKKQTGTFSPTSLDSKNYVFYIEGVHPGDGGNDTVLGQTTVGSSGHATITLDENKNGVVGATQSTSTAVFTVGSNGRATLTGIPPNTTAVASVLYLIDSTSGFIVGANGNGESGFAEQQTINPATVTNASFSGQFFVGTEAPTTESGYQSGTVTLNSGGVTGSIDHSGPTGGLGVDSVSPANGGTYSFPSPANTVGKGTVGNNMIGYAISGSKIILMDVTASTTQPKPHIAVVEK